MSEPVLATRKPYSVFIGSADSASTLAFVNRLTRALEDPRLTIYSALLEKRVSPGEPFLSRKRLLGLTKLGERRLDRVLAWLLDHKLVDRVRGRSETFYYVL